MDIEGQLQKYQEELDRSRSKQKNLVTEITKVNSNCLMLMGAIEALQLVLSNKTDTSSK